MNRNLVNFCLVLGLLFVILACVCPNSKNDRTSGPSSDDKPTPVKKTDDQPVAKNKDEGDFKVEHNSVTNQRYAEIDKQVRQERLMEKGADALNKALILPRDITLRTQDCNGTINAYYNPDDASVTVCYELMEHFFKVFKAGGANDEEAYKEMFDAIRFVFLHEVGHCLIDQYKLPVTGNEEDAADRCSAYINLEELGDDGVKAVIAAADSFQIESKLSQGQQKNMSDEHLLSEQRFYTAVCMLYGSDTSKYENLVAKGLLPKERAVRCETEYQKTVDSWKNLLAPWRKKD